MYVVAGAGAGGGGRLKAGGVEEHGDMSHFQCTDHSGDLPPLLSGRPGKRL